MHVAACPFPSPQGSQTYVRGLARALARRGHEVTVACYGYGLGEEDPEYSLLRAPVLPGQRSFRAGPDAYKPLADLLLAARLRGCRPDVLHAHNYEGPLVAALAQGLHGIPLVYSAHNTMVDELPTYFRTGPSRRAAALIGRGLDLAIPRQADAAIALHPDTVPVLKALGCHRVSLAPPGIDPEDLDPLPPLELGRGPFVLYAGNADAYQEIEVLTLAMRAVPEARLLIVSASAAGDFPSLPAGARFLCTSDFALVRRALSTATLAALPRGPMRGFPMKLLNYLGYGLPTVAAEGGAPDMPGILRFPGGDVAALVAVLRGALSNPSLVRSLGASAREYVLRTHSWEVRARVVEGLYRQLTTRSSDRSPAMSLRRLIRAL